MLATQGSLTLQIKLAEKDQNQSCNRKLLGRWKLNIKWVYLARWLKESTRNQKKENNLWWMKWNKTEQKIKSSEICVFWGKLCPHNPPIGSGDRVQTRLILPSLVWWPWKLGQGHQNLIKSFNYSNDTIHKVWPESIIWFKR